MIVKLLTGEILQVRYGMPLNQWQSAVFSVFGKVNHEFLNEILTIFSYRKWRHARRYHTTIQIKREATSMKQSSD